MESGSGSNGQGNRKRHRPGNYSVPIAPALSPTSDEKPLLDVCITVKFDSDEGDIEGTISVLQGTTIAGLISMTLSEYRDAFIEDWPHVVVREWNERFQRAFPIPVSEYARKHCEDGARFEAFFFLQGATLHKRFWYPANVSSVRPETDRLQYDDRRSRRPQDANPSDAKRCTFQSQDTSDFTYHKGYVLFDGEEDDAGSNVADSRLGASGNSPIRQEECSATGARNVDVKQEVVEADVDNIDLLVQEIVREGVKFEHDEGLDHAPPVVTASVIQPAVAGASLASASAEKPTSRPALVRKGTAARSSTVGRTLRSRNSKGSKVSGTPSVLSADESVGKYAVVMQPTTACRPSTNHSHASDPAIGGTPATKPKTDLPKELSAGEQLGIDHPDGEDSLLLHGPRVFAQYEHVFHPATVCG